MTVGSANSVSVIGTRPTLLRRPIVGTTGLSPHSGQLPKLVLVPAASGRLVEHRVELGGVHLRHLPGYPLAAEPLRHVEDRHGRTVSGDEVEPHLLEPFVSAHVRESHPPPLGFWWVETSRRAWRARGRRVMPKQGDVHVVYAKAAK